MIWTCVALSSCGEAPTPVVPVEVQVPDASPRKLIRSLRDSPDPADVPKLVAFLEDPSAEVRDEAADAVWVAVDNATHNRTASGPALVEAWRDPAILARLEHGAATPGSVGESLKRAVGALRNEPSTTH